MALEPVFDFRVDLGLDDVEEVVETPTSRVLLTDGRAYKVRKEVCWPPYLDYSTPARRRRAAARELGRGRSFSAELYLGLAELAWPGSPISEAAVAMRRPGPDYRTGLEWLRDPGQGDRLVALLLDTACRLHAETRPYGRVPEGVLGLGQRFRILFEECAPLGLISEAIRRLADRFTYLYRYRERARAGDIRELHGDLHAGNILTDGHHCIAFDFSDFDDRFLVGDVAIDYGFLCADLMGTGHLGLDDPRLARFVAASGTPLEILTPLTVYGLLNRAAVFAADGRTSQFVAPYQSLAERLASAWLQNTSGTHFTGSAHGPS